MTLLLGGELIMADNTLGSSRVADPGCTDARAKAPRACNNHWAVDELPTGLGGESAWVRKR